MGKTANRKHIVKQVCVSAILVPIIVIACTEVQPYRLEPGELFPDGKPVGQPYSSRHRDIRMVRVSSMQEADSFYTAMRSRHPECCADYTHEVPGGTYEVGIIYIRDSAVIAGGIREIHFVETVKPKEL